MHCKLKVRIKTDHSQFQSWEYIQGEEQKNESVTLVLVPVVICTSIDKNALTLYVSQIENMVYKLILKFTCWLDVYLGQML